MDRRVNAKNNGFNGMTRLAVNHSILGNLVAMSKRSTKLPIASIDEQPIAAAQQVLIVVGDSMSAISGQLHLLHKQESQWSYLEGPWAVSLGKSGFTYGDGLVQWTEEVPKKMEGDNKTPVGVFTLTGAYGYATAGKAGFIKMPYLPVTPHHKAVDDPGSRYYNQIVDERIIATKDWQSAEEMLRADPLYKWGLVVDFNRKNIIPGGGSCIFWHLWRSPGHPTAGCTAMSEAHFVQLLQWLQPAPMPVIVQADKEKMNPLLEAVGLHSIIPLLPLQ